MKLVASRVLLACTVCVVSLAALERSLAWLSRAGYFEVVLPPSDGDRYWDGRHPRYGVWRHPDASWEHVTTCFSVLYETNSVGARDRERSLAANRPRTIVLGDSFIAGWGVPTGQRLSDLLEIETGIEHLNFGMSHFSPYQSYLVYRDLASAYDHDTVIVGVLPSNDFIDLDLERARLLPGYEYVYRPYLVWDVDHFVHFDYRENRVHRLLRRHSYLFQGARKALIQIRGLLGFPPVTARTLGISGASSFSDFSDLDLDRLRHSLELLIEHAAGRRVVVLLIPVLRDLLAYDRDGSSRLSQSLAPLRDLGDVTIIDLLPLMADEGEAARRYYFDCDSHWNAEGHRAAARHVLAFYRQGTGR